MSSLENKAYTSIHNEVKRKLKERYSCEIYKTFIAQLGFIHHKNNSLMLLVPNRSAYDFLSKDKIREQITEDYVKSFASTKINNHKIESIQFVVGEVKKNAAFYLNQAEIYAKKQRYKLDRLNMSKAERLEAYMLCIASEYTNVKDFLAKDYQYKTSKHQEKRLVRWLFLIAYRKYMKKSTAQTANTFGVSLQSLRTYCKLYNAQYVDNIEYSNAMRLIKLFVLQSIAKV
jgi:hypothetical protein